MHQLPLGMGRREPSPRLQVNPFWVACIAPRGLDSLCVVQEGVASRSERLAGSGRIPAPGVEETLIPPFCQYTASPRSAFVSLFTGELARSPLGTH